MDNKDNYIFVIGKTNSSIIAEQLNIEDVYDVRDRLHKRLILSKLLFNNSKLLIESNFLKIIDIDIKKNKLILELDEETDKIFRSLDNKSIELLGELLEDEKIENMEIEMNGDLTFVPLVSDDNSSKVLRLCLDTKTTLKYNKNNITLDQIKVGDMFRFLIEIESINLYPSELICHIKQYCHMGEIYRTNVHKLNKRSTINEYKFSTDVENIFKKVVLEDQDISLIKTEKEPDFKINEMNNSKDESSNESECDSLTDNNSSEEEKLQNNFIQNEKLSENDIINNDIIEQSFMNHENINNTIYEQENNNIEPNINLESNNNSNENNSQNNKVTIEEQNYVPVEEIVNETIIKPKRKYTRKNIVDTTNTKNNTISRKKKN